MENHGHRGSTDLDHLNDFQMLCMAHTVMACNQIPSRPHGQLLIVSSPESPRDKCLATNFIILIQPLKDIAHMCKYMRIWTCTRMRAGICTCTPVHTQAHARIACFKISTSIGCTTYITRIACWHMHDIKSHYSLHYITLLDLRCIVYIKSPYITLTCMYSHIYSTLQCICSAFAVHVHSMWNEI